MSKTPDDDQQMIKLREENKFLKFKVDKLKSNVETFKNQIRVERNLINDLKTEKVNFINDRNELEKFFLECIEEIRKGIVKRKIESAKRSERTAFATPNTNKKSSELFQSKDKEAVIEMLLHNDNVLLFLYEKLFPHSQLLSNGEFQF